MSIKWFIISFFLATTFAVYVRATQVIANPYDSIDYSQINVYTLKDRCDFDCRMVCGEYCE